MSTAVVFGSVLLLLVLLLLPERPRGWFLAGLLALVLFAVLRAQAAGPRGPPPGTAGG
jgi:hypothetical protein